MDVDFPHLHVKLENVIMISFDLEFVTWSLKATRVNNSPKRKLIAIPFVLSCILVSFVNSHCFKMDGAKHEPFTANMPDNTTINAAVMKVAFDGKWIAKTPSKKIRKIRVLS